MQELRGRGLAEWLISACGVWLIGLGFYFMLLRPSLLAEDTRFIGGSLVPSASAVSETKIAGEDAELAAHAALKVSKEVEDKVQECADDLHAVDATLAQGVAALENTEDALAAARAALIDADSALATAEAGERKALLAARHDSATGLPNRQHFDSRLTHDIAVAAR